MSRKPIWLIILCILSPILIATNRSGSAYADGFNRVNYLVCLFEFQDLKHTTPYEQIRNVVIDQVQRADAATGDKAIEANNVISQAQDAVQKAETESRLKGLDEAKNQLSKANSAYADSQFANATTTAKTSIDLANAATKMATVTSAATTVKSETTTASTSEQNITIPAVIAVAALIATGVFITLRKRKKTTPASSQSSLAPTVTTP